ncbi:MAG TPA: lactate racemase domain-containing protein [Spirochaetia bacterium]|nr:lactate racemase domain-containing protein [Spirochaetia bacterium]
MAGELDYPWPDVIFHQQGSPTASLSDAELRSGLQKAFDALGRRRAVLALPPDFTRFHSRAGRITELAWEYYGAALKDVLPATGTHFPVNDDERATMFGAMPASLFRVHRWKEGLETLGRVPAEFIQEVSEGALDFDWPAQVDQLVARGGHDLILSIGQVVPHEVVGMAGHMKNVFIGTGGAEAINKSHYLGAVYGMERMMGRADTPVRAVLDLAAAQFAAHLPIVHVLTVVGRDSEGALQLRGLFVGDDRETFTRAAALAQEVNVQLLDEPLRKVVVNLDPREFKSTWLGNKSIYRTRMAIADGGELVVLAPGVRQFGEDPGIDALIRKYGYFPTPRILRLVAENRDLQENLSVAAHLIHGSPEDRFTVTYAAAGLTPHQVQKAGFQWGDLSKLTARYDPHAMKEGWNTLADGERVWFISNPATGLWASRSRFR